MRRSFTAMAALAFLLGACGGGSDKAATTTGTTGTTGAASPSTTVTTTAATTTSAGPGVTVKAAGAVDPGGYGWTAKAGRYNGLNGKQLEFGCPPGGTLGSVYGSGTYTDDSSVCSAAVHAGKMTQVAGGQVVIVIQPGQPSYIGSTANGVTGAPYGQWSGSFQVVSGSAFRGTTDPQTGGYGWKVSAEDLRGLNGQRFNFNCPPAGETMSVYGTGTYTDDSPVCSAAVHAGKTTKAAGGVVVVEIKPGQASYTASTANGITSSQYAAWQGSYSFA